MISSPFIYLLSLSVIVVSFVFLERKFAATFKFLHSIFLLYLLTTFLAYQNLWQDTFEIKNIYNILTSNLLPSMLFLMLLEFDFLNLFKRVKNIFSESKALELGCACSIGAKRYYPLVLLSILVSITSQVLANFVNADSVNIWSAIFATIFGVIGSFTKLKYVNGSKEIANTMLFFLVALVGSQTHLSL